MAATLIYTTQLMKKQLLASFAALVLFALPLTTSAQSSFHHLVMPAIIVTNALDNADFSYFDFSYQNIDGSYYLGVTPKTADSTEIGEMIVLRQVRGRNPRSLPNTEPTAHLLLSKDLMMKQNVNGSENYILTPEKTVDPITHRKINQVSYRFSNKVCTTCAVFLPDSLIEFDLNPSPPY
jgi:hypothetical protein